ncbi:iron ABC transporter permease [Oceanicola sp. 22II-s10i]|uniref:iron chelate uptake ABC transporter family permease subunit n=1 Tax=Oceanicola sp. 22II-s10i TaxID=1317116 RepID=UPI000B5216D1|nr:iron chelate uptake ABC transporter family permease subunit [Oceanicola sp. 22II-s10i]OWU82993.1 iron ABC transporter permease [Oceanicola sp. 22II-s10i]
MLRAGLALLAALACLSVFVGTIPLSPADLLGAEGWSLVVDSRLPRTFAAILAGAGLAITGQIMQLLARNRFVEPMTAGAGQSAALGILLCTLLVPAAPIWIKMAAAALAALAGSLILMALIRPLPPTQPLLVPLVALVYGGVIGAVVAFVAYQGDMMQFLGTWLTGELSGVLRGRYELLWIAAAASAATFLIADRLTLLTLGEDAARALGLNVGLVTAGAVMAVSVVTAMVVVTLGAIPFVGLVVPNLTARLAGDNLRRALPLTALAGALLVLAADIFSRWIRAPYEVPVATTVAAIGAVAFLALIRRGAARA